MKILLYDVIFDVESIFDVKSSVSRRNRELSPKNAFRRGEPLEGGGVGHTHDDVWDHVHILRLTCIQIFRVISPRTAEI